DVTKPEAVEQRSHAPRLLRHVVRRRGRGLAVARKVNPDDVMLAGECRHHRAPRATRGPRSVDKQHRRRLPRAVVDHVHPMQVLDVVHIHTRDDARATAYQSWTNVSAKTDPLPPCPASVTAAAAG